MKLLFLLSLSFVPLHAADPWSASNTAYTLVSQADEAIEMQLPTGEKALLRPQFTVLYSPEAPGYDYNNSNYPLAPRWALRWAKYEQPLAELNQWLNEEMGLDVAVTENTKGEREWQYQNAGGMPARRYATEDGGWKITGRYAEGTTNPFLAGQRTDLRPAKVDYNEREVTWSFAPHDDFEFSAKLILPKGDVPPEIAYTLKAKRDGWFAAVFTGSPGVAETKSERVPQQASGGNRKQAHFVIPEVNEKLPRAHVHDGKLNVAVVAHSDDIPMEEKIVTHESSRFGTMIAKEDGVLTPMIFAPVMGADSSRLTAGQETGFRLRILLRPGTWQETYRYIAERHFGFRDMRDNSGTGSLNSTIRNIMDFLRDANGHNHAMWHGEQKYYNYWSDKAGIFKPFSPIFGLSAAVVLDDEAFYRERVLPVIEFSLSRESNVFSPYDVTDTGSVQSLNRKLGKPFLTLPQLVTLNEFFQGRTYVLRHYAEQLKTARRPADLLAAHRLNPKVSSLDDAVEVGENQLRSNSGEAIDFLELYEATKDARFLEAARQRIYNTASVSFNLFPEVPDAKMTFDRGGRVPVHAHSFGRHRAWGFPEPQGLEAPEQTVPAWRGSEIGQESFARHRAELWLNHQPTLLRVAAFANDPFLRTLARWGLVGRYANYAGDNRSERSLVTELPDAPEHPIWKLTYSSFNPGHAWEFVGAMVDFLVSDCMDRSRGAIFFPPSSMAGSAFRVRAYGAAPGRFYDEEDVHLWMPKDLLTSDNSQADWLAGWGNGKLYLAVWNQSFKEERVRVVLNPERVVLPEECAEYREWADNDEQNGGKMKGGALEFVLPPKGLRAFVIDGVEAKTQLQRVMFASAGPRLGPGSFTSATTEFGAVHGMLLSMGAGLTKAFVYTDALPDDVISVKFRYRQGDGDWHEVEDTIFPFEMSVWVNEEHGDFICVLAVEMSSLKKVNADALVLQFSDQNLPQSPIP